MELFGQRFDIPAPPAVAECLRQAAACYRDTARADALLRQALALDPDCLAVYFALYKFHFYRGLLAEAEQAARAALARAAHLGDFGAEWESLARSGTEWDAADGPRRFYLFSLKALAFIRLRRADAAGGRAILAKLAELDPFDRVGSSVIMELAHALDEGAPGAPFPS